MRAHRQEFRYISPPGTSQELRVERTDDSTVATVFLCDRSFGMLRRAEIERLRDMLTEALEDWPY